VNLKKFHLPEGANITLKDQSSPLGANVIPWGQSWTLGSSLEKWPLDNLVSPATFFASFLWLEFTILVPLPSFRHDTSMLERKLEHNSRSDTWTKDALPKKLVRQNVVQKKYFRIPSTYICKYIHWMFKTFNFMQFCRFVVILGQFWKVLGDLFTKHQAILILR
jgi:hypothetical protein